MEKRIYNEQTGISYILQGDYYLPNFALPEQEDEPIGLWGQQHLKYIKQHRKILYIINERPKRAFVMAKDEQGFMDWLVEDIANTIEIKGAVEASRDENDS